MSVPECVLCDWHFDPLAAALYAYRGDETLPLAWGPEGPRTVKPSESLSETMVAVATVVHWAQEHTTQLNQALGETFTIDTFPRQSVYGSMAVAPKTASISFETDQMDPATLKLLMGFSPDEGLPF